MNRNIAKQLKVLITIFLAMLLAAACKTDTKLPSAESHIPSETPSPTKTSTWTQTATLFSSPTVQNTATTAASPTSTSTKISTPLPSNTPTTALPEITPVFLGTPIPKIGLSISSENVYQIGNVARWGKGEILGAAFFPDGDSFLVGSAFGFAKYNIRNLENPPQWVAFEQPFYYESMFFSEDGSLILLEISSGESHKRQIRNTLDGEIIRTNASEISWLRTSALGGNEGWGALTVNSLEDRLQFKSHYTHDEEFWDIEFSVREIFDNLSGDLLFVLPDETIQVGYSDWNKPEGCDLRSFSYCGNVYSPSASHPYRAAFSPMNESLAVLYRPPNLWNSNRFSTLRIYDANNGQVLSLIGSFDNPVETFAYSPNGKTILIGYVDGTIQLWDIAANSDIFNAWHFNSPIVDLEYSYDGKYVIIQRPNLVEVRLSSDGSLRGRYKAAALSVSPVENYLALGDEEGNLRVINFENGKTIFNIQAHEAEIYGLVFSPDGKRLTSSGQDCDVRNWNAETGALLHYFAENTTDAYMERNTASRIFIYHMQYVPGTNHLLGYGSWARVVSWNTNSGATQYLIEPEPLEYYQGMITLNPYFPEFFGVNADKQEFYIDYTTYSVVSGEKIGEFIPPENLPDGCAPIGPISKDGRLMFTKGYDNQSGQICVLNAESYDLIQTVSVLSTESVNYFVDVDWLYMSPNKDQIIVSLYGGVLYVYK